MSPSRRLAGLVAAGLLLAGACGRVPVSDPLAAGGTSELAGPADPAQSATLPADHSPGPPAGETCEYVPGGEAARPVRPPAPTGVATSGVVTASLQTTEGVVRITMDRTKAPCTVHSFESLARQGFYDDIRCHRLIDSGVFLLQCGDPSGTGDGGPGYSFADETDGTESYVGGVVAMANSGPNTNGSQFFLVYEDSTSLDSVPEYTIFGRMDTASRGVVARMAAEGQDGRNEDGSGIPNNPCEVMSVGLS